MNHETLIAIMGAFDGSALTRLEYTQGDTRILLEKAAVSLPVPPAVTAAPAAPTAPAPEPVQEKPAEEQLTAPLVGTFYVAPGPGAPAFVRPGDQVKKGQTVCIIEAMKMINEVPAPYDCVIERCLAEDGALVGYGDGLFAVRKK